MITRTIKNLWFHFCADSLFRNSIYLILSTAVVSGFGFFFWIICSRLYSPHDVGLATSLIAAMSLMSILSTLGFNNVIIRFLATSDNQNEQLSTAFTITGILSIVTGLGFLVWGYVTNNTILETPHITLLILVFILCVFSSTLSTLLESAFIAHRIAKYILVKNTVMSILKIAVLPIAVSVGFIGIFISITISTIISVLIGFLIFIALFKFRMSLRISTKVIRQTGHFAISNYTANLFGMLPATLLPLIVVSRLGTEEAAFFYMPMMIVTLLNIIPTATAQSLFAEVSHNEMKLMKHLKDAAKHLFLILIPSAIIVLLLGKTILSVFGQEYVQAGSLPLIVLTIGSIVAAINYLGNTLLNIKKLTRKYTLMNAISALSIVILAFILAPRGLFALSTSILIGQVITLFFYFAINWKLLVHEGIIPSRNKIVI